MNELATVEQRAALALKSKQTEIDLSQLADELKTITIVNSPAGREQAHSLAMRAVRARTSVNKACDDAREDAVQFSKSVVKEGARLIAIIQPDENRVKGLRDQWDEAEEKRKEEIKRLERERIERHTECFATIRAYAPLAQQARTSAMVQQLIEKLSAIDLSSCEEFTDQMLATRDATVSAMTLTLGSKRQAEEEQARIKAEQEAKSAELAKQQEELASQQAEIKAQKEALDKQAADIAKAAAELEAVTPSTLPVTADGVTGYVDQLVASQMSKPDEVATCGVSKKTKPVAVIAENNEALEIAAIRTELNARLDGLGLKDLSRVLHFVASRFEQQPA